MPKIELLEPIYTVVLVTLDNEKNVFHLIRLVGLII